MIQIFQSFHGSVEASDIDPKLIRIEITETVLMENPETSIKVLKQFVNRGFHIELDDFGSGYSSLSYLYQYPISTGELPTT